MLKALVIGFCVGLAVALIAILANLGLGVVFGSWTLWIWPSSIFLLGTAGAEHTAFAITSVALAVLVNGLVYAALALVLRKVLASHG